MASHSRKTQRVGPKKLAKHRGSRKRRSNLETALAEAEADVKAGRVSKPFKSVREFVRAIRDGKRLAPR